ncbi:hypothetical protein ICN17_04995 [Polynucleobacter sp. 73C-SIWE]|uniref:hypothetical protein n=1 Tax=Polynucleobacter sp. 73C-SIWE TaxID=2689098 RepID=UPI001C0D2850|nr:hypothetical protein [Polynucleobacter sp. 73C-SIWE]MBU3579358.1 hypothetical protein [Polynucleobacter sp. 73C-SIWE]
MKKIIITILISISSLSAFAQTTSIDISIYSKAKCALMLDRALMKYSPPPENVAKLFNSSVINLMTSGEYIKRVNKFNKMWGSCGAKIGAQVMACADKMNLSEKSFFVGGYKGIEQLEDYQSFGDARLNTNIVCLDSEK